MAIKKVPGFWFFYLAQIEEKKFFVFKMCSKKK